MEQKKKENIYDTSNSHNYFTLTKQRIYYFFQCIFFYSKRYCYIDGCTFSIFHFSNKKFKFFSSALLITYYNFITSIILFIGDIFKFEYYIKFNFRG